MTTFLDTINELNKGLNFVKAASMALHGGALDSDELNALDRILSAAQEAVWVVQRNLSEVLNAERESQGKGALLPPTPEVI